MLKQSLDSGNTTEFCIISIFSMFTLNINLRDREWNAKSKRGLPLPAQLSRSHKDKGGCACKVSIEQRWEPNQFANSKLSWLYLRCTCLVTIFMLASRASHEEMGDVSEVTDVVRLDGFEARMEVSATVDGFLQPSKPHLHSPS